MAYLKDVLVFVGLFLVVESTNYRNNSYFILSPDTFRPGSILTLKVMILKASGPVDIRAGVKYRSWWKKNVIASSNKTFMADTTEDLSIKIPEGLSGYMSCNLFVKASGGLMFNHESRIWFRPKWLSIYVQTDKAIYKADQTVHMRIFALLPNLRSYLGKMTVDIVDPNNFKMAHWTDLQEPLGIIKKDFPLSSQTVKGRWQIVVTAKGEKMVKYFEVKDYVLPKFEVSLTLPPYILKKDTKLQGSVISKYTYGQNVKGSAMLEVSFNHIPLKTTFEMDGTGSFSFEMKELKTLFMHTYGCRSWVRESHIYNSWYTLKIKATVTDKLTGRTASTQGSLRFYQSDVRLHFPSFNPKNFKPGLDFVVLLKVTKPNGQSIHPDTLKTLQVTTTTKYGVGNAAKATYTPSPEGTIVIRCDVPHRAKTVRIEAEYHDKDSGHTLKSWFSAAKSLSPSNSYIHLSTSTPAVKSGQVICCKVVSNFPMASLVYLILGRGSIRRIVQQNVTDGNKEAAFNMTSTSIMAPSVRIVVYSIRKDSEVVVDALTVSVENPFDNEVSLSFQNNSTRPGRNITLVAKATPGSHVAILAVDKSVLLMKKSNDISRSQVLRDVQSYSGGSGWYPWWDWGWFGGIMAFPVYGVDANSVFKDAGLITFSDCLIYRKPVRFWFQEERVLAAPALEVEEMEGDATAVRRRNNPLAPVTKVRSFFPETWLWMDVNASSNGEAEVSATVPDTMTSWVASAFAISPKTGFGIGAMKPHLRVFQPFFVSLDLPFSVVRGEEIAVKVLVFNYLEETQKVTITFKESKDLNMIANIGARGMYSQKMNDIKKVVTIPAGQGTAIAFPVIPVSLGNIPLVVQAQSYTDADAVRRNLLVKPEGIPQYYSFSLLLELKPASDFTKTLQLALPESVVPGSAHAKVTLIGDLMGSSFNNLHNLLRMPYGCGEQNMVNFAPTVFIFKYLTAINQVTPTIKSKAERYMIKGYLGEQRYRHKDGAYSAFGERDPQGSMWLTAFVVKSFAQARKYIYIDPRSMDLSLRWIQKKQKADGSFPKVGYTSTYLKGGLRGEVSLTAFVVIALVEAGNGSSQVVASAKQKAFSYLEENLDSVIGNKEVYALAITTYALRLVNSRYYTRAKQALLSAAIRKAGTIYWSNENRYTDWSALFRPYYKPRSGDIEITAYALLALSLDKDIVNGLPVVRWLAQQRNSLGGYASTQDTVLGIQAMSEIAALIYSTSNHFKVELKHSADKSFSKTLSVDRNNMMVLQQVLLSKVEGNLTVTADGHGIGMLQVGVTYYVNKEPKKSNFEFSVKVIKEGINGIETKTCARWQGEGNNSDMAVIEVGVISGFHPDGEVVAKLMNDRELLLKRVDPQENKLIMYFDKIDKSNATCFVLRFERTHSVGKGKPVPAVVYDYYNPEHRAQILYTADQLKDVSVCRVCPMCINCQGVVTNPAQKPAGDLNKSDVTPPNTSEKRNSCPDFRPSFMVTLPFMTLALFTSIL